VGRASVGNGPRVGFRGGRRPPTANAAYWRPWARRLGSSPRRGKRWTLPCSGTRGRRGEGAVDDLVGNFAKHAERLAFSAAGCKGGPSAAGRSKGWRGEWALASRRPDGAGGRTTSTRRPR
jgi:hypothetical protein